jgi:hypothetical protein
MSIAAVVGVAASLGAGIAVAVTWFAWWQGWGHWYPEAPLVSMVIAYAAISVLGFGNSSINLGRFAAAFFVGLVAMLVVGMTISEVVHCSFDRNGCFNL